MILLKMLYICIFIMRAIECVPPLCTLCACVCARLCVCVCVRVCVCVCVCVYSTQVSWLFRLETSGYMWGHCPLTFIKREGGSSLVPRPLLYVNICGKFISLVHRLKIEVRSLPSLPHPRYRYLSHATPLNYLPTHLMCNSIPCTLVSPGYSGNADMLMCACRRGTIR